MKTTGIIRKIDELGRLVIPKEIRDLLEMGSGEDVEIRLEGNKVVLTKYTQSCIFCSETSELVEYEGRRICSACIRKLNACTK